MFDELSNVKQLKINSAAAKARFVYFHKFAAHFLMNTWFFPFDFRLIRATQDCKLFMISKLLWACICLHLFWNYIWFRRLAQMFVFAVKFKNKNGKQAGTELFACNIMLQARKKCFPIKFSSFPESHLFLPLQQSKQLQVIINNTVKQFKLNFVVNIGTDAQWRRKSKINFTNHRKEKLFFGNFHGKDFLLHLRRKSSFYTSLSFDSSAFTRLNNKLFSDANKSSARVALKSRKNFFIMKLWGGRKFEEGKVSPHVEKNIWSELFKHFMLMRLFFHSISSTVIHQVHQKFLTSPYVS